MNVENDNAEPACANLELSLGNSNHCISSRSSGQGAGVNATASRVDMTFVTSCPSAELIWSQHSGLSLKCADCSFVAKSTPLVWDVGPSILVNDGSLVKSQSSFVVFPKNTEATPNIGQFAGKGGDMEEVNSMGKALVADDNRKESISKNEERGMHGENDRDNKDYKTMDFLSPETNEPLLHENQDLSTPMPRSSSPKGRRDSIFNIENQNETKLDCSTSVLPLERLEFTAENELPLEKDAQHASDDRLRRGNSVQIETSPAFSKTLMHKDKGKGKVLSEGDACKIISKEKDDSCESVESCGSVGLLVVGKKRERFEQNLFLGSKRVKNQIQENPISTSLGGQHSSFINWISNMMNVSNRIGGKEEPYLALALTNPKECHVGGDKNMVSCDEKYSQHGDGGTGFRTFFQSIYCPKQKEIETKVITESTHTEESKEHLSAERVVGPSAAPISCHGFLACADRADRRNSSSSEIRAEEKIINDADNKFDNPGSFWITRFSRKSHEHFVNLDGPFASDDKGNEMSTLVSTNLKDKEVMASVFAKRIDALKLIAPSEVKLTTCFYCGKIGHDLRNCSDISETDRDYFITNIRSNDGIEETYSCLCVRCFQIDHWAISCPKAHMFKQKSLSQLEIGNAVASTRSDDEVKGDKLPEVPEGMFGVIRKLRLSRTDILKWMNSHSSLSSLGGYFLRLRLGKWEKGPCGSGYYAARIKGEHKEKQLQGSKGPIAVDIGDKSFLVESQHISNQNFLEGELTEWWITSVKSGTAIPSGDELKVKLEERIRLGF